VKVKTSVTLSEELLKEIDGADSNRSIFLERAARHYLAQLRKSRREASDARILEDHGDRLNREALDVLEYQDPG
jgi:metal-responsive CopG/Arc/MetJ family transcriptional regulator